MSSEKSYEVGKTADSLGKRKVKDTKHRTDYDNADYYNNCVLAY